MGGVQAKTIQPNTGLPQKGEPVYMVFALVQEFKYDVNGQRGIAARDSRRTADIGSAVGTVRVARVTVAAAVVAKPVKTAKGTESTVAVTGVSVSCWENGITRNRLAAISGRITGEKAIDAERKKSRQAKCFVIIYAYKS